GSRLRPSVSSFPVLGASVDGLSSVRKFPTTTLPEEVRMSAEQSCTTAQLPSTQTVSPRPRLATWLRPKERTCLDAFAVGSLAVHHCSTLRQVRESVGLGRVDAAVFSTA